MIRMQNVEQPAEICGHLTLDSDCLPAARVFEFQARRVQGLAPEFTQRLDEIPGRAAG